MYPIIYIRLDFGLDEIANAFSKFNMRRTIIWRVEPLIPVSVVVVDDVGGDGDGPIFTTR